MIRYSLDAAPENIKSWIGDQPGFGVVLFDLWPLAGVQGFNSLNLACWAPVDHDPVPPLVSKFAADGAHHIVAMSEFGYDRFLKAGVPKDELSYIPHAIDRSVFYDRGKDARKAMGIPEDAFLVVTNAANRGRIPIRKGFGEMADAMATFMRDRPDVYWMLHTEPHGHSEGVNIPRLVASLGINQEKMRYPAQVALRNGIPSDSIAQMMSAADVQLLTSMGEGFGIPAVEGMATGVPCIVSDFSAQPELIGPHSRKVPVQRVWDEFQVSFFGIPNVAAIVTALQEVYEETKGGAVDRAAVSAAMAKYDHKTVYAEKWRPLIEKMTARRRPITPAAPLNRAQRRANKSK